MGDEKNLNDNKPKKAKKLKVALLGVSFINNNLGLRALAYSTVNLLLRKYEGIELYCFSFNKNEPTEIKINNKTLPLKSFFLHFGKKFCLPNHILHVYFLSLLYKWFHLSLFSKNSLLGALKRCDVALDLSGGDSFSDIYGMRRFRVICLQKMIVNNLDVRLVLLPQTYGPFRSKKTKTVAKNIINRVENGDLFARDNLSSRYLGQELGINKKVKVFPDLVFSLSAKESQLNLPEKFIGLNISGLLYGSRNKQERFKLSCDYPSLINEILSFFLIERKRNVVLIPHVLGNGATSDIVASDQVMRKFKHPSLSMIEKDLNEQGIRSILKKADFFMGSRMHVCIGAISQLTPTLCLAYSRKFKGVMEIVDYDEFIIDMKVDATEKAVDKIKSLYNRKGEMTNILKNSIPEAQKKLGRVFDEI